MHVDGFISYVSRLREATARNSTVSSSEYVLMGNFDPKVYILVCDSTNIFWGDVTHVVAKNESLVVSGRTNTV